MGWDYYTYQSQPRFFIEELLLIMNQEYEIQKLNQKMQKARSKRRK